MASTYPGTPDSFSEPSEPEGTPLSEAGTGTRNHYEHHRDLGDAIENIEANASLRGHDHSGNTSSIQYGNKLQQVNTHENVDTDSSITSIHHTLGYGGTQAAPGNHAHNYAGSSIYNKPLEICTSTTRPIDPQLGKMIWETDTNVMRVWAGFPENTYNGPIYGVPVEWVYYFDNYISTTTVNPTYFDVTYPVGNPATDGAMASPATQECEWVRGVNTTCRAIARSVVPNGYDTTATDDQMMVWVTGKTQLQGHSKTDVNNPSPTNDAYLRMSADGQSYLRIMVSGGGVSMWYTTTGPTGETYLAAGVVDTEPTLQKWTFKAVGNRFLVYVTTYTDDTDGPLLFSAIDYQNVVSKGEDYRGWAFGMSAVPGPSNPWWPGTQQLVPADLKVIGVADMPFYDQSNYTNNPIWQLIPGGTVPHLRLESHFRQDVAVAGHILQFDTKLWDWNALPFSNLEVSRTDIVIREAGHYSVHASIVWDPSFWDFDHAMVGITVNSVDIGRKHWVFMRGYQYPPGFPQTIETFFSYHFAIGDIVRVFIKHNANIPQWLWYWPNDPDKQMCFLELDFLSP